MRFAVYSGTSMVLATGVIIRALHQRPNFYSACVYLAQSNACLMVLTNIALLGVCTGMLGLQRLFYGQLRPIEVEQLYEKAWFAITETCLAMTIFREEVGGWFLVMFVCLLIGKVWGWIGEGRVEILEQQPPSNPRLFHARLSVSLTVSTLFDISMLRYSVNTVLLHARPNMMVMFAFEFAVLTVTSISTAARYTISLHEARVIKNQIQDRRAQIMRDRRSAQSRPLAHDVSAPSAIQAERTNAEDEVVSLDIDVPGWEEKGRWVFYLDLATDFFKLILYLTFFCVLCMFYGMPIHIIRDVALTIRSFYKRITDFVRYRQATRDMNARYPDATAEEVGREDVCIICREEMRPWQQPAASGTGQVGAHEANGATHAALDERLRPKKLPCGHILHFACLRSWLERQQNCPTCRRPVLTGASTRSQEPVPANHHARDQTQENPPQAQAPAIGNFQQPVVAQNVFTFGPLRIAFGARAGAQGAPQQANNNPPTPNPQGQIPGIGHLPRNGNTFGFQRQLPGAQTRTMANFSPTNMQLQLHQIEHQLIREINSLRVQQNQLYLVRALQGELARLRIAHANSETISTGAPSIANPPRLVNSLPHTANSGYILGANPQHQFVGPNHSSLPPGMALPPGWSVLPLQRLTDERNIVSTDALNPGIPSVQSPMQHSDPPTVSAAPAPEVVNHGNPLMTTATSTDADSSKQLVRKRSETPKDVDKPDGLSTSSPNSESSAARQHIASVSSSDGKMEADTRLPISPTAVQQWGSGSPPIPPNDETETKSVENDKITGSVDDFASDSPSTGRSQAVSEDRDVKGKSIATTVEDFTEDLD